MSTSPELSVVIPTFNVGPWIRECLNSVLLDQSTPDHPVDMEVIVIDDQSTDDTWAILQEVASGDSRIHLVRGDGSGGGPARNAGVALAHGEYLAFVDGDDLVPRGAYATMLASLRETGSDLAIGDFYKFWSNKVLQPSTNWRDLHTARTGVTIAEIPTLIRNRACWNKMFRLAAWREAQIEFPAAPRSNDILPMTRALLAARTIDVLPRCVYLYRARPGSGSMTSAAGSLAGFASYLRQEAACARAMSSLREAEDLQLNYHYAVLRYDGWVHLEQFFATLATQSIDESSPAVAEIRSIADDLLTSVDRMHLRSLHTMQWWAWALFAQGAWSLVSEVVAAGGSNTTPRPDWFIRAGAALVGSPHVDAASVRKAIDTHVHRAIWRGRRAAFDDTTAAAVAKAGPALRGWYSDEFRAPPRTSRARAQRALLAGDVIGLRQALRNGRPLAVAGYTNTQRTDILTFATRHFPRVAKLAVRMVRRSG